MQDAGNIPTSRLRDDFEYAHFLSPYGVNALIPPFPMTLVLPLVLRPPHRVGTNTLRTRRRGNSAPAILLHLSHSNRRSLAFLVVPFDFLDQVGGDHDRLAGAVTAFGLCRLGWRGVDDFDGFDDF